MNKITTLGCFLILFIFSNRLNAQIIYTDIPDATPNVTYPLDLNNDGIVDFLIQFEAAFKAMCKPQNSNAYSGEFVGGEYLPWALSASSHICDTLATWYDANHPGTMASGTSIGHWLRKTDKYLALKLVVGTNTYYGWARLDFLFISGSFTVKDYAYQSTPNACIESGQTALGIHDNSKEPFYTIYSNPSNSSITLQTSGNFKQANLTICNSFGQTVRQVNDISGQHITISSDNLTSGMYFVQLKEENRIVAVEKLIINH